MDCGPHTGKPTAGRTSFRQAIVLVAGGTFVSLLALELGLRFLPVADPLFGAAVDAARPVAHYVPDQHVTYSKLPFLEMANRVRTNNYGFVNDQDYDARDRRPLIAFIGDSQIEALMVAADSTVVGRMQHALAPRARAYSFAMSGAPLSQYLAYAAYARATFKPDAMVVTVVHNDYDESLLTYKSAPGFHYFRPDAQSVLRLTRIDRPGAKPGRRLVFESALARYLLLNVGLVHGRAALKNPIARERSPRDRRTYVANTHSGANARRIRESKRAVDVFLDSLPAAAGLPRGRILLLVDGIRPQLYDADTLAAAADSYAAQMRDYLLSAADDRGFEVTDLQPRFMAHFQQHRLRFEFPRDGHWNQTGHAVAFAAVGASQVFREFERFVRSRDHAE